MGDRVSGGRGLCRHAACLSIIARKTVREKKALQRTYSLKKNAQFKYVHRRGHSSGSHEMVLLYVRANTLKVGFSVGKKIGCAVKRNRVKRRLRAACVPLLPRMKPGLYIFIARQPAETADFKSSAIPRAIRCVSKTCSRRKNPPRRAITNRL